MLFGLRGGNGDDGCKNIIEKTKAAIKAAGEAAMGKGNRTKFKK